MAAYANFKYYQTEYGGTAITEQSRYEPMARRASAYIDYITMNKATTMSDSESVKMACCALAEQYRIIADLNAVSAQSVNVESAGMQSQSVGSYSVTYRDPGESARESVRTASDLTAQLYTIAAQYLANTGLLYRGGGCRKCTLHTL